MLKNLSEQSGLFLERGVDSQSQPVYGFLHQTFGEYLAALHLAQEMQGGTFELKQYIHRSVWHEPLLLMAGHLSVWSPPQANQLVRDILDSQAPFEDVLQRGVLLAAECLADDVQVQSPLRDEILEKLARILEHEAPQVQEAAGRCYEQLAVTRHREAAVASLKRHYPLAEGGKWNPAPETRLSVATALMHLDEKEPARPIFEALERDKRLDYQTRTKVQRLLFEGWPSEAAEYLLQLQADPESGFSISPGQDLASSTIGPVDLDLARRVLGEDRLLSTIEKLSGLQDKEADQAAFRWLAAITPEITGADALVSLILPDLPAQIRLWAAVRLLAGGDRPAAVRTLHNLAESQAEQSTAAVAALLAAGEEVQGYRRLTREVALMANNDEAPAAIGM
jgi:hypothetical protein